MYPTPSTEPLSHGSPQSSSAFPRDAQPSAAAPALGTATNPIIVASASGRSRWSGFFLWVVVLFAFTYIFNLFFALVHSPAGGPNDEAGSVWGRIAQSAPEPVDLESLDTTFSTICGCDEAKGELEVLVSFLKDPEKFTNLGGRLPKGVLLVGPPGCGKTLLAKAIAKEAGVNFFYAAASEFDEMFVGVGPRRIRDIFAAARRASPALIFIDEIDALATKRSTSDHGTSRMSLNQLLSEMDGFKPSSSVIVIAATNTPEVLDKAITRPGRLDTIVAVDPPDMKGRAEVLQVYLNKVKHHPSIKAMDVARGTSGFTGAELSNVVNLAAIHAATLDKDAITPEDLEYAKDRVMMGAESKKVIPAEERRITAFHEGGHALAALLLQNEGAEPIHKATIVPRGNGIMGLVQQMPKQDRYSQTKKQCLARLKVCLAGRVGEEMILGTRDVTTGASSDFQQASELARRMIKNFGFSTQLGMVYVAPTNTPDGAYISDETKRKIDEEVQKLVTDAYGEVKQLLQRNEGALNRIANELLERETLTGDEIQFVFDGKKLPVVASTVAASKPSGRVTKEATRAMSAAGDFSSAASS